MTKTEIEKINSSDIIVAVCLFIAIALIPLVSVLAKVPVNTDEYGIIRSADTIKDVFSFAKAKWLKVVAVATVLAVVFQIVGRDGFSIRFKSLPVILSGVLALFALVSSIFSKNITTAFSGAAERYEGMWIWLCYIVFFIVTMAFCESKKRLYIAVGIFMTAFLLSGLIGFFQAIGLDIFKTDIMNRLVRGSSYKPNSPALVIRFDSVFGTFYNPNCAGMYYGFASAFAFICALFMPVKKRIKYVFAALSLILLVAMFATDSIGGLLGFFSGTLVSCLVGGAFLIFKKKDKKALIGAISFAVVAVVGTTLAFILNPLLPQKLGIITDAVFKGNVGESASAYKKVDVQGKNCIIETAFGVFSVEYNGEDTLLSKDGAVYYPDEESESQEPKGVIKTYKIFKEDTGMQWCLNIYPKGISKDKTSPLMMIDSADESGNTISFIFVQVAENEFAFADKFSNPVGKEGVSAIGFKGLERLGSNRGYIWSRSIPVLFRHIIFGAGADCFEFEFPQEDVYKKLEYLGNPYQIIDKPHSIFLQVGINFGLVSLLLFVFLYGYYVVTTVKTLFAADENPFVFAVALGFLAAVTSFFASGLTTDSVVSVSPVFWCIFGAGFGVNTILKREEQNEQKEALGKGKNK